MKQNDQKAGDAPQREGGDDALASNPRTEEGTPVYLTGDSTLQTPEEDRKDKANDPRDTDTISVSRDDLHDTKGDRLAGSDRAGSAERKDNSMD